MDFNKKWALSKSKAEFVKQHLHLATKEELEAIYDKLVKK